MTNTAAAPSRKPAPVGAAPAGERGGDGEDFDRQEIRLAVVMNGGVSLAIWISGVTLELHHLAMARRWDEPTYRPLLDLLQADARVDVIAGTSAGGLNGAFLALGLAHDRDLSLMRDLWRDHGSLEKLLRDPLRKHPPSLLMGTTTSGARCATRSGRRCGQLQLAALAVLTSCGPTSGPAG